MSSIEEKIMSQSELIRFPARLLPKVHEDLVAYSEQQGESINTCINELLKFGLYYALKGNKESLDEFMPDQESNLLKIIQIIDKYLLEVAVDEYAANNSEVYLEFIGNQFKNLKDTERKILSDVAYALANKK